VGSPSQALRHAHIQRQEHGSEGGSGAGCTCRRQACLANARLHQQRLVAFPCCGCVTRGVLQLALAQKWVKRGSAAQASFSGCMHALLGRLLAVGSLYWWAVRMSATSGCHAGFCLHGCCASGSTELETLTAWSQSGEATSVVRYCELQRCTAEPNVQTPCSQCSWTPNAVGRERS